jgi:hypothetical protein
MKKSKLKIHKETLRQLSTASLDRVGGGGLSVATNTNPAICGYSHFGTSCIVSLGIAFPPPHTTTG